MHPQSTRKRTGPKPRPVAERFWEKVDKHGPIPAHRPELGPCWIWNGSKYHDGYGMFGIRVDGKPKFYRAHRIAFEIENGPITEGLYCLHHCDNHACVNPAHLWEGTQQDNMTDKVIKDRQSHGDTHYMHQDAPHEFAQERRTNAATLTGDQVREIRRRYDAHEATQYALAAAFGVTNKAISKIVRRERWTHIE